MDVGQHAARYQRDIERVLELIPLLNKRYGTHLNEDGKLTNLFFPTGASFADKLAWSSFGWAAILAAVLEALTQDAQLAPAKTKKGA